MKQVFVISMVLGLLAAGGAYFFGSSVFPSTILPEAEEGDTVRILETGFSPRTLIAKKGTTVRFINETNTGRWPASDPHPTHGDYPGLDPRGTVPPGGTWSFTFEEVGEWNMHDHLNPSLRGKIIIVE